MNGYFHSVALREDKCRGCTSCISTCPTEAIRVRKGKARIILERCIDCGECIRVCPSQAKIADTDPLKAIRDFDYRVAVPAPSLYGQFKVSFSPDHILTALKKLGFDDVFEVALAADYVARELREYAVSSEHLKPLISSSCPAVVRLIQVRFPSLLNHVAKIKSPMETAGRIVRNLIHRDKRNLGIFFITPCPAKRTSIKASLSVEESALSGAIALRDIYVPLRNAMTGLQRPERLAFASGAGIGWAGSDGEAFSAGIAGTLTVDGIHRVIGVLECLENGSLKEVNFIEAMACPGGCVGGPLNAENPSLARSRIRNRAETPGGGNAGAPRFSLDSGFFAWEKTLLSRPVMPLSDNVSNALERLQEADSITAKLPGLDCGSCGSPSCRTLAEDIVRGTAEDTDCIFVLRERIRRLTMEMVELEEKLPPSIAPRS